ncbi:hypothetical protein AAF712_003890 [Marasmius tenuissimus]|uniref:Uncharacterized protein n=1 Tax=Marasmius tenuissimus TaxID=585030 RepID=A0ABR3A4K1_9AGAR
MAPTVTTTAKPSTSASTSANQANGSRNPVAFGSSAPRTSGSTKPSQPSSSSAPASASSSSQPARSARPIPASQENTMAPHEPLTNASTADSASDDLRRRSSSHNSLFDGPNTSSSSPTATPEDMLAEMNKTAARKGKAPMANRPLIIGGKNTHDNDRDDTPSAPEDTDTDTETRSLRSIRTVTSNFARNESLVRSYHATLRRCYVLQTMRDSDLMQYSTTRIEDQRVHTDDRDMIYHDRNPQIRQPARPIEDDEVAPLRMIYPEPFSDRDPIHGRRAPRQPSPVRLASGEYDPPYAKKIRDGINRHLSSSARGRGGIRRGSGSHRSMDTPRNRNDTPPTYPGGPDNEPSESESEPNRGTGRRGHNGGPPSDDPSGDPSGEPSDGEPHNSEDEYNRRQKRSRTDSTTPPQVGPKPSVFGRTQYSSVDPTFNEREVFEYDPTPKTEEEVLRAAFRTFEKLIERQLYGPGSSAPNNAQKTVIQNIPRPGFYYGEQDFLVFDDWVRDLVRWLNVANLCGEEVRWSKTCGSYVLTAVDMFRKNTLVSFLRSDARDWFVDVIESTLENDNDEPVTFMQVVSGLYRRFIHESSLSLVVERYEDVRYSAGKGAKGMFSELSRYAKSMPSPPDLYSFKKKLMLLLPESMETNMRKIHRITAESSSVNDIMQAALACEKSNKAGQYYQRAREELKRAKRRKSRSRSRDHKKKDKQSKSRTLSQSPSPKRLQKVENRRYSVRAHSPPRGDRPNYPRRVNAPPRDDKTQQRRDHNRKFQPFHRKPWNGNTRSNDKGNNRFSKMDESKKREPVRLNRIAETTDGKDSPHRATSSGSEDNSSSSKSDTEGSELIGSQYSSDAADEEYMERVGFMRDDDGDSPNHERLNAMASTDDSESEYPESGESDSEFGDWSEPDDTRGVYQGDPLPPSRILNLDFGEYMKTMVTTTNGDTRATLRPKFVPVKDVGMRPARTPKDNRCLTAFIKINGLKAFALFDSGSMADAISPDFARIAKLPVFQLENPVTLQLGTKGSRSRISFGCTAKYSIASSRESVSDSDYFDIANIDRYDVVIGTVFMRKHGISLHFSDDTVRLNEESIPTLNEGEESAEIARRYRKTVSREIHLGDGEQLETRKRPNKYGIVESTAQKKQKGDPTNRQ